jgi:hypothetical protein
MPVRYCQIAIFQGFRVAIPGRESGLNKSHLGGGETAVSGALGGNESAPRNYLQFATKCFL